jgi:hypothetical protein
MATISTPSAPARLAQHDGIGAERLAHQSQGFAAGRGDEFACGGTHVGLSWFKLVLQWRQ